MNRWRNHAKRSQIIERECEEFCSKLRLTESREDDVSGRWYLRGPWTWVEVVTLRHGLYVGGDIETVVFSGHPGRGYGVRSPVYWMATRSYGYAAEKARMGNTLGNEWDAACARASVLDQCKQGGLSHDQARALLRCLDHEEGEHAFQAAVYEETGDSELCDMGEVVSRRVYLATAVLRRLVAHFESQPGFHDDTCATCGHASESHHAGSGRCYKCPAKERCSGFVSRTTTVPKCPGCYSDDRKVRSQVSGINVSPRPCSHPWHDD